MKEEGRGGSRQSGLKTWDARRKRGAEFDDFIIKIRYYTPNNWQKHYSLACQPVCKTDGLTTGDEGAMSRRILVGGAGGGGRGEVNALIYTESSFDPSVHFMKSEFSNVDTEL